MSENIKGRPDEGVVLKGRRVDDDVRAWQRGVKTAPAKMSKRGKSINI